jgi:hypothetical protein
MYEIRFHKPGAATIAYALREVPAGDRLIDVFLSPRGELVLTLQEG